MFALDKSKSGLEELKEVLYAHYSSRLDDRLKALWESGKLNQQRLDEINEMDTIQHVIWDTTLARIGDSEFADYLCHAE